MFTPVEGKRFQTNAAYAAKISRTPRKGVLLTRHTPIDGCWVVRFDGVEPVQYVNEAYMEAEGAN